VAVKVVWEVGVCDRITICQDLSDWQSANCPLENVVTSIIYNITNLVYAENKFIILFIFKLICQKVNQLAKTNSAISTKNRKRCRSCFLVIGMN